MTVEFNTITMMKKLINIQSLLWLVVVSFFIVSCCKQEPIDTPEPINEIKLSQKLQANDGLASDYFGSSVAISGDYAIVGAFSDTVGGNQDKGSAYIFQYSGSSWSQQAKLIPSDGMIDDHFGYSVSISGDYAIVGTGESDINWTDKGSAYIFHRTGNIWVQQAKLLADDGMEGDEFGYSVSISGDYAIVGAYHDDIERNLYEGSAYIFHRTGDSWSLQAKLTASDGRRDDHFGYSVSISGDYAIVGAVFDNVGGNYRQGSAYIFHRNGSSWEQQVQLTASDGWIGDQFGYSVSISGDYAIVGAYNDGVGWNHEGYKSGSAYVFHHSGSTWTQQAWLTASDGGYEDHFGNSVSITGDHAMVGAYFDDNEEDDNQGSVYIFNRTGSTWMQQTKLSESDGGTSDNFGYSVSISDDYALIGAWSEWFSPRVHKGSVYIYDK